MSGVGAGWTRVVTDDGSTTLAHPRHGEACHSRAGAWTESRERYAQACRVRARALELAALGRTRFALLDVGTGLGLNLAAALEALEGTGVALDATSLEIDTDVIAAALELGAQPLRDLERAHAPVRAALAAALLALQPGHATSSPAVVHVGLAAGTLRLLVGDGALTLAALEPDERFDAVFLDPFSPRIDPPLWAPPCLREVARRMSPGSLLSTYTASLRVRAGLRAAGLNVGPGARVQRKAAGTLASPDGALMPFDERTGRKVEARARALCASAGVSVRARMATPAE